jgi:hypothetical protein
MQPRKKLANMTADEVNKLASRRDTIVMQEEYAVRFEPWDETRVRSCVHALRAIAVRAPNAEAARAEAVKDGELRAFSERYTTMFARMSTPEVSRNDEHVRTVLALVDLHERMRAGELSEAQAKSQASDTALASLLRQAPGAPNPPREVVVEELYGA